MGPSAGPGCSHVAWSLVSLTPVGHPAGLHGAISRAGRHAAPAARLLSARGYQWGLSSLMEVQMANKTKCRMCLCLQNHWVTQWFTNDWLWLLLCQRKHLEKKRQKRDSICSSRWDMESFMLPFRVTNVFTAAHLTLALPFFSQQSLKLFYLLHKSPIFINTPHPHRHQDKVTLAAYPWQAYRTVYVDSSVRFRQTWSGLHTYVTWLVS